jgi:mono/diheme cytochrome c family protein
LAAPFDSLIRKLNSMGIWVRRAALFSAIATVLLVGAFIAFAWPPAIPPAAPPASFDTAKVARGAQLAKIGNCAPCHTAASGQPLAGGRPLRTRFGTIYGTNITQDRDTGIGLWSEAAFVRSMREGIARDGRHLYPAFPYTHFTRLTDADLGALYAYLMTRPPVRAETPANELRFPYNLRPLLAGWNFLFLHKGPFNPDPSQSEVWNRGAYLSEAFAHCGVCHTPRNRLGPEDASRPYGGGEAEGWWAPPLDNTSPAPVPWSEASLFAYLRSWDEHQGGAVGPMAPVSSNLADVPETEVRAIATYIALSLGPATPEQRQRGEALLKRAEAGAGSDFGYPQGAAVYAGVCATCHESGGQVPFTLRSLARHTTLYGPDPRNVIRVVLRGIEPPEGAVGGIMPGFAGTLTEAQVIDLIAYLRARFSDQPPWAEVAEQVRRIGAERDAP